LEKYVFEVPISLIEEQVKEKKNIKKIELKDEGKDRETIQAELERFDHEIRKQLDRGYRLYFLTEKAAQDLNIKVDEKELVQEMMQQTWLQQLGQPSKISSDLKEMKAQLQMQMLTEKTLDYLIDQAKKLDQ